MNHHDCIAHAWTAAEDCIIKVGLDDGLSRRAIAALLVGRSHNAVIGRVYRNQEKFFGDNTLIPPPRPRPPPRRERIGTTCDIEDCYSTAQRGYSEHKCAEHLTRPERGRAGRYQFAGYSASGMSTS